MNDDILDRAKQCLSDYEWAKACKVAVAPDRPHRILAELVAEVEHYRSQR